MAVAQCGEGCTQLPAPEESVMANKDRGNKSTKKAATKTLKQKRLEKKSKKGGASGR